MSEPPSGVFFGSLSCFWVPQKLFAPEQDLRRHDLREACKPILVPRLTPHVPAPAHLPPPH